MEKSLLRRIMEIKGRLNDEDNLLYTILFGVGPVLEGIKPSAMLNFTDHNRNMNSLWKRRSESIARELCVNYLIIDETESRSLVMFYDEKHLSHILSIEENLGVLWKYGYSDCRGLFGYIEKFKERFCEDFPHESGILLGIPHKDVTAFIENDGKNYMFCGYWKVYSNPEKAEKTFMDYDNAILKSVESRFFVI